MPAVPVIVNDVSYVTTINDAYHFRGQGGAAVGEVGG